MSKLSTSRSNAVKQSVKPPKCKHVPANPDVMQTVCTKCGKELDLR